LGDVGRVEKNRTGLWEIPKSHRGERKKYTFRVEEEGRAREAGGGKGSTFSSKEKVSIKKKEERERKNSPQGWIMEVEKPRGGNGLRSGPKARGKKGEFCCGTGAYAGLN